jgi:hypothetical protein
MAESYSPVTSRTRYLQVLLAELDLLVIHPEGLDAIRDSALITCLTRDEVPPRGVVGRKLVVHGVDQRRHYGGQMLRGGVNRRDVVTVESHELGHVGESVSQVRFEPWFVNLPHHVVPSHSKVRNPP